MPISRDFRGVKLDIKFNRKAHDRVSQNYEKTHTEIFNPIEQGRLRSRLLDAKGAVSAMNLGARALDFGCGSGNLSMHLIELDFHVVAMDISQNFLSLVQKRFADQLKCEVLLANGEDLSNVDSESFDLVATYSVLHHVPDYLKIVREMTRVLKKGGVLYLDHEPNQQFWDPGQAYLEYLEKATPPKKSKGIARFFSVESYVGRFNSIFRPRYQPEGDIHVWPDDHIEWEDIKSVLSDGQCDLLREEDYLLYRTGFDYDVYMKYRLKCSDMKLLLAQKR